MKGTEVNTPKNLGKHLNFSKKQLVIDVDRQITESGVFSVDIRNVTGEGDLSDGDYALPQGIFDQVSSAMNSKLSHKVGLVPVNGLGAENEHSCDFLSGMAFCQ